MSFSVYGLSIKRHKNEENKQKELRKKTLKNDMETYIKLSKNYPKQYKVFGLQQPNNLLFVDSVMPLSVHPSIHKSSYPSMRRNNNMIIILSKQIKKVFFERQF